MLREAFLEPWSSKTAGLGMEADLEELPIDRNGAVATITLSRPDKLNALSTEHARKLGRAVARVRDDSSVRCVVIAGSGRAFCAGADIAEFGALSSASEFRKFIAELEGVLATLEDLPQPCIAAVHGLALGGGCELAMACDLRVADESARLGLPEIKLGLLPGASGTQRAIRLLPRGVGLRMLLTGEPLMATEALRLGLVDELVPIGTLREAALRLATRLAAGPPRAMQAAKQLVRAGSELPLREAIALERDTVAGLFDGPERPEGVAAFLAKRAPKF